MKLLFQNPVNALWRIGSATHPILPLRDDLSLPFKSSLNALVYRNGPRMTVLAAAEPHAR